MTNPTGFDTIPQLDWLVESIRVTAFPIDMFQLQTAGWFQAVLGDESEQSSRTRVSVEENGPYPDSEDATLTLRVELGRIDWFLRAATAAPGWDSLGGLGAIRQFTDRLTPWLALAPAIRRLALAPTLLAPVESSLLGYEHLSQLFPMLTLREPENLSDLLLQFNRPTRSAVTGEPLNRLVKSSVALQQTIQLRMNAGGVAQSQSVVPGGRANRLEIDVNTSNDRDVAIPADQLQPLISEMADNTVLIARRGDNP